MNVVERQFAESLLYFYMMFWVYQQHKVITTQPEPFLRVVLAACNLLVIGKKALLKLQCLMDGVLSSLRQRVSLLTAWQ